MMAIKIDICNKPLKIIGMMTGTSLDGIDCAVVQFPVVCSAQTDYTLFAAETFPYSPELKILLQKIICGAGNASDISTAHFAVAKEYSKAAFEICQRANLLPNEIYALGIHGQTVWHDPCGSNPALSIASTLQICSASALAAWFGKPVVSDFRAADISLGGQGAPLVPIFDYVFLRSSDTNVIALNIGGIANLTHLPPNCAEDDVSAFDTGPGNTLIDSACRKLFGIDFDKNGDIASRGVIIEEELAQLLNLPYFQLKPPKSTGRELFNETLLSGLYEKCRNNAVRREDAIRTLTEYTAITISEAIKGLGIDFGRVIVAGGGAKNHFLMNLLTENLPLFDVIKSDSAGIKADYKEAICFAYLAYRTLLGLHGNLPSVTGAKLKSVLGSVSLP